MVKWAHMDLVYDAGQLASICQKYQADYLGVFGSVARGDAQANSDIDLLVRFSPQNKGGLFELSRMRDDLEKVMTRKVDLLTEGFLSKYFKDEVIAQAKTLYVKA
jgi:uncharacterized protein